jgi:hypothetical protein
MRKPSYCYGFFLKKIIVMNFVLNSIAIEIYVSVQMSCELSLAQLVRLLVAQPVHSGSNPIFGTGARIFLDLHSIVTQDSVTKYKRYKATYFKVL